jgi:hypothetical protein
MESHPKDRRLYVCFACYFGVSLALPLLSYFYGDGYIKLAIILPILALLVLLGVQWHVRTRCSAFAFFLVLAGLFAVAYMTLALSYGAVAANVV